MWTGHCRGECSIRELHKMLHRCNEQLLQFSHVNKRALDLYVNFTMQREEFQKGQAEVDAHEEEIRKCISFLDQCKDEEIERTFKGIARHFREPFSELVQAGHALDLCINQMKNVSSSQRLPEAASMETIGCAYRAIGTIVQGLVYCRSILKKLTGVSDLSSNYERSRDADDASSDAGSSSMCSQSTDELSELLTQADIWLGCAELLQSLLGLGIAASLDDIADKESSARLHDRLIVYERDKQGCIYLQKV